jgi:hypothetical protein
MRARSCCYVQCALVLCAVAATPLTHSVDSTALQAGESNPFLIQSATDGLCLLGDGSFKRCGIDTLWYRSGLPGEYQIHHRPVKDAVGEQEGMCLGRKSPDSLNTSLKRVLCTNAGNRVTFSIILLVLFLLKHFYQ